MEDLLNNLTTTTASDSNGTNTTPATPEKFSATIGFIAVAVAVVCYAINYLPVKKFETGDGLFFQWVMCNAVMLTGIVVNAIVGFPEFHALTMVGGAMWATGNVCVVPIFKTIGMALGILIWATFNMVVGWACGRFGWFGIKPEVPNNSILNYIGVGVAAVSAVIYVFIKSEVGPIPSGTVTAIDPYEPASGSDENKEREARDAERNDYDDEQSSLIQSDTTNLVVNARIQAMDSSLKHSRTKQENATSSALVVFIEKLSPTMKRVVGVSLSIFAGTLYGLNFLPSIYIQDNYPGASQKGLDYVFAQFCGIFLASNFFLILYAAVSRNRPIIYPRVILPGMICGLLWSIGSAAWFVANEGLSQAVSFPIITALPALLATLIATFGFREIRGMRNYLLLLAALLITGTGVVLTAFSKL